ncbi:MAG: YdbL family protein [Pseudomonadota bacterium]|jgi:uncharacterized protein|nr:YdbL family protein [Pseudomonadota bacterium]
MKRWHSLSLLGALLALAACVTINVYFPAAAAEKAADRIIGDVLGAGTKPAAPASSSDVPLSSPPQSAIELPYGLLVAALNFVVPPAQAQADLDISSPEIQKIKSSLESRSPKLRPLYEQGAVGFSNDGLIALRDPNAVPLAQRNAVKSLIADENADRIALYRQIAQANGQPQWEAQIRQTFAERWIANAPDGWWHQNDSGAWVQK